MHEDIPVLLIGTSCPPTSQLPLISLQIFSIGIRTSEVVTQFKP